MNSDSGFLLGCIEHDELRVGSRDDGPAENLRALVVNAAIEPSNLRFEAYDELNRTIRQDTFSRMRWCVSVAEPHLLDEIAHRLFRDIMSEISSGLQA
jgi:hypothetical protein